VQGTTELEQEGDLRLVRSGHAAYLVGGCVRDLLLGAVAGVVGNVLLVACVLVLHAAAVLLRGALRRRPGRPPQQDRKSDDGDAAALRFPHVPLVAVELVLCGTAMCGAFLASVADLDPNGSDFSTKVDDAIKAAVAANPKLKAALAAGASTVQHAGGPGEAAHTLDAQIEAARKAGKHELAISLQRQKAYGAP
jgi:hypothetical protein